MAEKYRIACECGKTFDFQRSQAGETIQCPCGKSVALPTLRDLARFTPIAEPSEARQSTEWGIGNMLVVGGIVALVFFLCLSYFVYSSEPVLFDAQRLTPRQAWMAWERMQGALDREPTPDEKDFLQSQRTHDLWWFPVGLIGLIGLGLLATGVVLRRRPSSGK